MTERGREPGTEEENYGWGSTEAREDDASQRSGEEAQRHHRAVSLTGGGEGKHVGDRYCVHCRIVQGA